ncbi:hypothetical protein [uncultured Brevibacterium sp.]|uniref:hypothetical protein n=1 Tax=uncultured Brevibacterium sp. TaxID=189678 RepID=UPI0025D96B1E|nr:hypothetical protein [uncultured Brevibacterium sp.]
MKISECSSIEVFQYGLWPEPVGRGARASLNIRTFKYDDGNFEKEEEKEEGKEGEEGRVL